MRAQGLPINTIVIITISLIVLVVAASFFITGMGRARMINVNVSVEECRRLCQELKAMGVGMEYQRNFESTNSKAIIYWAKRSGSHPDGKNCDCIYGPCEVTFAGGEKCWVVSDGDACTKKGSKEDWCRG